MAESFYLTTTLPYVNAEPHIGFALEIIAGDVICRWQRSLGKDVVFNTGTDEHGQKIYQNAVDKKMDPQSYVDEYAAKFDELKQLLNLSYNKFIRTTNPEHKKAALNFWILCCKKGDIYKKLYAVKYCVGCELEKTDSELVDGRCPLHPNRDLEIREEENYFFKFSNYQQQLLDLYKQHPDFVQPEGKMKEIVAFVQHGLQDFSISRLKEKMPWGVEVPEDPEHVMYVWFDALINYISTIGWPNDMAQFEKYWPVVQLAGKDNLRQQSAMWQSMLMSAGVSPSRKILINGFISVDGQKMSKSLGNVISPTEMVEKYGVDGTRYILMYIGPFSSDMDVSWEKFDTLYESKLQNGIGNVCSRIAKLCENINLAETSEKDRWKFENGKSETEMREIEIALTDEFNNFEIKDVVADINSYVNEINEKLSILKPWKLEGEDKVKVVKKAVASLIFLSKYLKLIMPETGEMIQKHFTAEKIVALTPMFPRLN